MPKNTGKRFVHVFEAVWNLLAFPPTVDLRAEGLGRHLAMFLKGAEKLGDARFIIVCPSWSQETLHTLFESEQVSAEVFEIASPQNKPYILSVFEAWRAYRSRFKRRSGRFQRMLDFAMGKVSRVWQVFAKKAVAVNSFSSMVAFLLLSLVALIVAFPISIIAFACCRHTCDQKRLEHDAPACFLANQVVP